MDVIVAAIIAAVVGLAIGIGAGYFVRKNISLRMMDPLLPGLRLFRGDGDQDRPC